MYLYETIKAELQEARTYYTPESFEMEAFMTLGNSGLHMADIHHLCKYFNIMDVYAMIEETLVYSNEEV